MGKYYLGTKCVAKTFCKKCGVNLTNTAAALNEGQLAKLNDTFREFHQRAKLLCPVNLRVLNDFHVSEIKDAEKAVAGAEAGEPYINP